MNHSRLAANHKGNREWTLIDANGKRQKISTQRRKGLEQEGRNQNKPQRHRDTKKSDANTDAKNAEKKIFSKMIDLRTLDCKEKRLRSRAQNAPIFSRRLPPLQASCWRSLK